MGTHMGFGMGFGLLGVMATIMFVVVIGSFVAITVQGIGQRNRNNNSPVLTVPASVVAKRGDSRHEFTSYYVTFQVESGDRLELHVADREYGMLAEGDHGNLTFQGTRYIEFDRI